MESQTPSPKEEVEEEKPRRRASKNPDWWDDQVWVWLQPHHRLTTANQRVVLERTTERLGEERIIERIPPGGKWVWRPDADMILHLGPLAPCCGNTSISKPFFRAQPPTSAMNSKPEGPPTG